MGHPRNPANSRVATSLRLPSDLLDAIDREAEARVLSRTRLVELLLRDGLRRLTESAEPAEPEDTGNQP